jgi:hypothetical protein
MNAGVLDWANESAALDGGRRVPFAFLACWPAASEPGCWAAIAL